MKASSDLFNLIKSLSPNEKRYFRLYASTHVLGDKNNYELLFDAIYKQHTYDETAIKKIFIGHSFINRFAAAKQYLHNLILKSLHRFHASSSSEAELKEMLHYVKILFDRGLYLQCKKLIKKIKIKASHYENYWSLLEAMKWEAELVRTRSYIGVNKKKINEIYQEIYSLTNRIYTFHRYEELLSEIYLNITKTGDASNNKQLKIPYELLKAEKKKTMPVISSIYYYFSCGSIYYAQGNYKKALWYSKKEMELFEKFPHHIIEHPKIYGSSIVQIAMCSGLLKQYDKVLPYVVKIKKLNTKSEQLNNELLHFAYNIELSTHIATGEFEKGEQVLSEMKNKILSNTRLVLNKQREMLSYFHIGKIYFGLGKYSDSGKNLHKIINDKNADVRSDIFVFAKMIFIIAHNELGNSELISYLIKSTRRDFEKRTFVFELEKLILQFIEDCGSNNKTNKKQYSSLLIKMKKLKKNEKEKKPFDYFDFISWAESKVENKKFADIVKIKSKKYTDK